VTLNASVGELVQVQFPCFDIDGVTPLSGLIDVDFGKLLLLNNTVSAVVMTVSEVGATGRYVMQFTPNADGLWYAEVTTEVDDIFADQVEVGPPPDDWLTAIATEVWSTILPGAFPASSAGYRLATVDANVADIHDALIMAVLTATGGGVDGVETNAAQVDGFYDNLTLVVRNAAGNVSRRIDSYEQLGGTFLFADDLPFIPAPGDEVIVLGILGKVLCENSDSLLAKLVEIWQRLGLDPENPLCISKTEQTADGWKIISTVVGNRLINTREDT